MQHTKYKRYPFLLLCLVALVGMSMIFYEFGVNHAVGDFIAHNPSSIELFNVPVSELSFPLIISYPIMHITVKIIGLAISLLPFASLSIELSTDIASVVVATSCNFATILLVRFILNKLYCPPKKSVKYLFDLISVTSVFIIGICGPLTDYKFYLPQGAPNVWHNPTFIFVRPFGLVAFYLFLRAFEAIKTEKNYLKKLCVFSFSLALSCVAKPNYAFVLMPAMGILTLIEMSDNFVYKFKKIGVPLLLSVLPAGIILILQFIYVSSTFADGNVYTIIKFGSQFDMLISLAIRSTISMLAIPLTVFAILGLRRTKSETGFLLSLLAVFVGWVQYYFLYQTGHAFGDYFWGYGLSTHLSTFISLGVLIKHEKRKHILVLVLSVYLVQLLFGFQYFSRIIAGNPFYDL